MNKKFPQNAKYKRFTNRIYFYNDFKEGEELEFAYTCEKPNSNSKGNAWYRSLKNKTVNLINIKELH